MIDLATARETFDASADFTVGIEEEFGGWDKVNHEHLNPEAKLDQVFGGR